MTVHLPAAPGFDATPPRDWVKVQAQAANWDRFEVSASRLAAVALALLGAGIGCAALMS